MSNTISDDQSPHQWIPLSFSASFILKSRQLLGWSLLLVLVTIVLTWLGFLFTTGLLDGITGSFFSNQPAADSIWGWIKYFGWAAGKWVFLVISRIIAFFLAFLAAYSLSAPFYVFLSTAAEKRFSGEKFEADEGFSVPGVLKDLLEGIKIGFFGIFVTIIALVVSFAPLIGQAAVFLLYVFYSTLMFIDYPASRRRWSLGRKIGWISRHGSLSFRLGLLPAVISMIPILNMFLIALLFPLLTVHSTLNFYKIENACHPPAAPRK